MGQDDIGSHHKVASSNEVDARPTDCGGRAPEPGFADHLETMIDPRLDQLIGRSLEAHYADIASSPLPDAILVMLAQLEAKERSK